MILNSLSKLEGLSRKEREKLFKKHEIISAAAKLFANKGFDKTTLDEIASASEFGKGTIYNYFSSKEEIFTALLEDITTQYLEFLKKNIDSTISLKDLVEQIATNIFSFYVNHPEEFVLMHRMRNLNISFNPLEKSEILKENLNMIRELYRERISESIQNKEIKDVDIESLQLLIQSLFFGYLHQLHICKKLESIDVNKEVKFLVDVLFKGIENK